FAQAGEPLLHLRPFHAGGRHFVEAFAAAHTQNDPAGKQRAKRAENLCDYRRVIAEGRRQDAGAHDDARRAGTQRTEPRQRRWGVPVRVLPWLEMVADKNRIEARLLRQHRKFQQSPRRELLGRRLVPELQHRKISRLLGAKLPPVPCPGNQGSLRRQHKDSTRTVRKSRTAGLSQAGTRPNPDTSSSIRSGSDCSMTRREKRAQVSISTARTACLTRGIADAFMLNDRMPSPSSSGVKRGLAAISPHTDTGIRMRSAASAANCTSRSTAGCIGSYISATSVSALSTASVYAVRSLVPIAKKSASSASASADSAAPGVSIMMPSGGSFSGIRSPRRRSRRAT